MTRGRHDWRTRKRWHEGPCSVPGCTRVRFPGLAHCYEHASKDAMALLVEDAVRMGYRPGLLRMV